MRLLLASLFIILLSPGSSYPLHTSRLTGHLLTRKLSPARRLLSPLFSNEPTNSPSRPNSPSDAPPSPPLPPPLPLPGFRPAIPIALSAVGLLDTLYITFLKANPSLPSFCPTSSCLTTVLNSPYSTLPYLNTPLSVLGILAYATTLALCLLPKVTAGPFNTFQLRHALSTVMAAFSIGLIALLAGVLKASCAFCVVSIICR